MDPQQVIRDNDGTFRCRDCGFRYALDATSAASAAEQGVVAVRDAVSVTPDALRSRRPRPEVWSINAYTAHLVEVGDLVLGRVRAIAESDRPHLPAYDQDAAADAGRFDERPAEESLPKLEAEVQAYAAYLRGLPQVGWRRVGMHAEAGEVRLCDIAHDLPHELTHHAADIGRVAAQLTAPGG